MANNRKLIIGIIITMVVTAFFTFTGTAVFLSAGILSDKSYEIKFDSEEVKKESIEKFNQVKDILKNLFYEDVEEDTLLEGAVEGMARSLKDPYTVYLNEKQYSLFSERSEGSYVGIGVSVNMDEDGLLTIIEPFADSPAQKAGMRQGDKIIKVDDEDVTGIRDENVIISMIKGKEDTHVKITAYRPSENIPVDFNITRKKIKIVNVISEVLKGDIGYIRIKMFDAEVASYFHKSLNDLLEKDIRSLIIDVRDNPGGAYDQVVDILDRILPQGIIVYTEDRENRREVENSDRRELDLPLAVLTNERSASASEILAGAIKDHKKGTIIGTTTFGKGLVQIVLPLEDGSAIKVTVAKYYTPSGVCIQEMGVEPDIVVEMDEEYRYSAVSQIPKEDDDQLQRAIQLLNKIS